MEERTQTKKEKQQKFQSYLFLSLLVVLVVSLTTIYFVWREAQVKQAAEEEQISDEDASGLKNAVEQLYENAENKSLSDQEVIPREKLFLEDNELVVMVSSADFTALQIQKLDSEASYIATTIKEKNITGADLDNDHSLISFSSADPALEKQGLFLYEIEEDRLTHLAANLEGKLNYRQTLFSNDSRYLAAEYLEEGQSKLSLYDTEDQTFGKFSNQDGSELVVDSFSFEGSDLFVIGKSPDEATDLYFQNPKDEIAERFKADFFSDNKIPLKARKSPIENILAVLVKEVEEEDSKTALYLFDFDTREEIKKIELPDWNPEDTSFAWAAEGQGINLTHRDNLYYLAKESDFSYKDEVVKEGLGSIVKSPQDGLLVFQKLFINQEEVLTKIIIYDIIAQEKLYESEAMPFVKLIGLT
ncbi:hypothetical protein KKC60_02045 [Patescibacteria group bacterium]|nr:hypothetical protein [Patescibacteria group bacterium]